MDSRYAVEVENLVMRYGGRLVVEGLDLSVRTGELLALLGPNGAGKTTTVEVLEGLRRPDSGRVRVLGRTPWTAPPDWRSRIGVVLQDATDFPELTVQECIDQVRAYYPLPLPTAGLVREVGLGEHLRARVRTLSGGQRRRLDVALALVGQPELLFLDEPTTGFDPAARRQFWALVRRLHDQGRTIVLTTHYLEEAQALAERVVIMRSGRVLTSGTPEQLRTLHGVEGPPDDALPGRRASLEDVYLSLVES